MKKILLGSRKHPDTYVLVDNEDYNELIKYNWSISNNYAIRRITKDGTKKAVWMHRVINNTPKGMDTDHINRNTLDNRKSNLRTVTRSYNNFNQGLRVTNTSSHKGVYLHKKSGKWCAYINLNYRREWLGTFNTFSDACKVRRLAEIELGI